MRGRAEDGFTLVAVLATLLIVLLTSSAALALALRRIDTSMRDRSAARAVAAADAGADVAGWRMNRTLLSQGGAGLLGFATDAVRQLGCTSVGVGSFSVTKASPQQGWCPQTPAEVAGDGATFRYTVSLDVQVIGTGASGVLVRRVVVTGTAGGVSRRILATYKLDVNAGKVTKLWRRARWVTCTTKPTTTADGGCADPGT